MVPSLELRPTNPDLTYRVRGRKGYRFSLMLPLEGTDPQRRHDDNMHKHLPDVSVKFISLLDGSESSVSANKQRAFKDRGNTETGTENRFLLRPWEKQKFFRSS